MDIASMSNSLEIRAPFLDYRMMEFAATVPLARKLNLWQSKYLLKKLAEKFIPKENIYRRKWGFGVPIGVWFRGDLKPYLYSIILSDRAKKRGYFNYEYVRRIIEEHLAGRGYHEHKIWSLLWLELWNRMFIDKELKPNDSLKDMS
jgi:asparagine synthase (glutamine-hydrolysing)